MSTPLTERTDRLALVHELPRRDELVGVAAELARTTGAAHVVLALDPRRFAAGAVSSPGCPAEVLAALKPVSAASPASICTQVVGSHS